MAYTPSASPLPPPPPNGPGARNFSNRFGLHQSAVGTTAQNGISPVNQMSNGFGGRQGGNPGMAVQPGLSGGNRTQQHVMTPGNNNVSYASPTLLGSAQSLYQKAQNAGGVAPVNGMSLGFKKITDPRMKGAAPAATTPVPPPPPTTTGVGGTGTVTAPSDPQPGNLAMGPNSGGTMQPTTTNVATRYQNVRQLWAGKWKIGSVIGDGTGDKTYKVVSVENINGINVPIVRQPDGSGTMIHPAWQNPDSWMK